MRIELRSNVVPPAQRLSVARANKPTKDRTIEVTRSRLAEPRSTKRHLTNVPVAELATLERKQPLSEKARNFVKHWASGESVHVAALKAGYANSTYTYQLVHLPEVIELYNAEKKKYEEAAGMTRKRVMDGLLDGIEMCKLEGDGQGVISGWKTVGQMCGYFEPMRRRVDINVQGNVMMGKLSAMSDADLLRVIQERVTSELLAIEHDNQEAA